MSAKALFLSSRLTLQNYKLEIGKAVDAVDRYDVERLGGQFACWRDSGLRDVDREFTVRMIICVVRAGKESAAWW